MRIYAVDMAGKQFGKWTVLRRGGTSATRKALWLCRCECGKESLVDGDSLRRGGSKSCGCLVDVAKLKHGKSRTTEHVIWGNMIQRCTNPKTINYKDYGGRGIIVCQRWRDSFENFLSDMGKRPSFDYTLDRIDNNGNYEPGNCKWSTQSEQNKNQRRNKK